MERDEWFVTVMLVVLMAAMTAANYLPNPWNYIVGFGTYAALFIYTFLSQELVKYKISAYKALDATIVPALKRETFLVKGIETVNVEGNYYLSVLHLFNRYNDPDGGRKNRIYMMHYGPLNGRMEFKPGKVRYSGMLIPHRGVETIIVARDPAGYVFRGSLYPLFHLYATATDAEKFLSEYTKVWTDARRAR